MKGLSVIVVFCFITVFHQVKTYYLSARFVGQIDYLFQ